MIIFWILGLLIGYTVTGIGALVKFAGDRKLLTIDGLSRRGAIILAVGLAVMVLSIWGIVS